MDLKTYIEIAVRLVLYFAITFAAAWTLARERITAPLRKAIQAWLEKRYGNPDEHAIAGYLTYMLGCAKCQAFWYGLVFSPIAYPTLDGIVTPLLRPLVLALSAYVLTILVHHNMKHLAGL